MSPQMHRDLVFDVGAHRGEDSAYYLRSGFRVVAVECDPEHVRHLKRRFPEEIADGRLTLVESALARESGPVTFFRNRTVSVFGTIEPAWAQRNIGFGTEIEEITLDAVTPRELFVTYGIPYFLKVDIEGTDTEVLKCLEEFAARPVYVSIESETNSYERLRDEFTLLSRLGYEEFKLSPQHSVQSMRLPPVPAHGGPSDYRFEEHGSGPFGEDLPGRWLTAQEALSEYKGVFILYDLFDALQKGVLQGSVRAFRDAYGHDAGGWYDTHARHRSAGGATASVPADAERLSVHGPLASVLHATLVGPRRTSSR